MSLSYKRDSLTNFRAQKARENLRREMGAEEIRRASEKKRKGAGGKKVQCQFVSEYLISSQNVLLYIQRAY